MSKEKLIEWQNWQEMCPNMTWPVFCAARREIASLYATIDKLPKCWRLDENGKRVQDVPVVPGMNLWCNGDWWVVLSISNTGTLQLSDGGTLRLAVFGDSCSNTREAAKAEGNEA